RVTDLAERCRGLAARLPVEVPDIPGAAGDPGGCRTQLERARAALHSVEEAAAAGRRRAELEDEDIHLQREEGGCRAIGEDAVRAAATRTRIAEELARELDGAGLPAEADPVRAVAAFRQAC